MDIVIVGGGFAGISTALSLSKKNLSGTRLILISDKPHMEYHPALYKVVTGHSPMEVCIPLTEVFKNKKVEIVRDTITVVDPQSKRLTGASGSSYHYDYLVLALGSETAYFNIPGLKELSYGFKSINEALKLKRHLHELFDMAKDGTIEQKTAAGHVVVVGGGASGVELSGELVGYTKKLAKQHKIDASLVTVDLIEAAPRLMPMMSEEASKTILERLHSIGVNVFLNRAVIQEEVEKIHMKDMEMNTKTVIWTSGVKTNSLYQSVPGLQYDKKGKVLVDGHLKAQGSDNIFIAGDGASTQYSGMAQTAIHDGDAITDVIATSFDSKATPVYVPTKPFYSIPVGPNWALTIIGPFQLTGRLGWFFRQMADLRYFASILPLGKALAVFQNGKAICESCDICSNP